MTIAPPYSIAPIEEEWALYSLDLMTQTPNGEVPWSGTLSFSSVLNDAGSLTATVPATQVSQTGFNLASFVQDMILPLWTNVWVVTLNSVVVWCGIPVQCDYSQLQRTYTVTAKEVPVWYDSCVLNASYLNSGPADWILNLILWSNESVGTIGFQVVEWETSPTLGETYTEFVTGSWTEGSQSITVTSWSDDANFLTWLEAIGGQCGGGANGIPCPILKVNALGSDQGLDLAVDWITPTEIYLATGAPTSGSGTVYAVYGLANAITPDYPQNQFQTVSSVMEDITSSMESVGGNGVEFTIRPAWSGDGWGLYLPVIVAYPRLGLWYDVTELVIDLDMAVDWHWPIDGTGQANVVVEMGGGVVTLNPDSSNNQIYIQKSRTTGVGTFGSVSGTPVLTQVESHPEVPSAWTLANLAFHDVTYLLPGVVTPQVTILAGGSPSLLDWNIGDDARIVSGPNEYFPDGYDSLSDGDSWWRIVQHEVSVPESGPSTVQLTLNFPPSGT